MAVKDQNSLRKLLQTCSDLEALAGELYRTLAKVHKDDDAAHALWLKTAREEDNHQLQFDLCLRLASNMVHGSSVSQEKADRAVALFKESIVNLRNSPPSVPAALKFAIRMETAMLEFHTAQALDFTSDQFLNMFKAMMNDDREHIKSLQDFLQRYESR
ncbi:hypothetical protein GMSM_27560 [Geomonas sp. Red276]